MSQPPYDFSGIVSTADQKTATYLPLESLAVNVFIVDVSARVVLSQVYSHDSSDILSEAYYVFPVPARAAVCSFELRTNNGMTLKGFVKELSKAKEEYDEARSKGWLTGLLEQCRQDVFVVSIGAMPPNTDVTVTLSYVVDLSEDDQNTVRFQLSSHVGARYGAPLNSALYHGTAQRARLSITVDIEMPGPINVVQSLHHNPFEDLPVGISGATHRHHFARKRYTSADTYLDKDFLLIIHASELDLPRCFSEYLSHRDLPGGTHVGPSTALALTLVPQFVSNIKPANECIFVIDRSGSMSGDKINMARQALLLLLRYLPNTSTYFNICSFGSTFELLWPTSMVCDNINVSKATSHAMTMDADMGGTELLGALTHIFGIRNRSTPTNVFVLTDGDICYPDGAIHCVSQAVSSAHSSNPVRVFTLGIGHGASTALCQNLAWAGKGSCLMTVDGEDIALKAITLVTAMQTPQITDLSIDWGVSGSARQAPFQIPAFSPGMRFLVTAIIPGKQVPTRVVLRVRLVDGSLHEYPVQVQPSSHRITSPLKDALGRTTTLPPLIHTLSAHLHIQDLEGDLQTAASSLLPSIRDAKKDLIVELGERYQVASLYTAFVAVAVPSEDPASRRGHGHRSRKQSTNSIHSGNTGNGHGDGNGSSKSDDLHADGDPKSSKSPTAHTPQGGGSKSNSPAPNGGHSAQQQQGDIDPAQVAKGAASSGSTPQMPGAFGAAAPSKTGTLAGLFDFFTQRPSTDPTQEVVCVPNPLGNDHPPTIFVAPPAPLTTIVTIASSWLRSISSFVMRKTQPGPGGSKRDSARLSMFPATQNSLPSEVVTVARCQSVDGSFSLTSSLTSAVELSESRIRSSLPLVAARCGNTSEAVWATAIAVAFFRVRFPLHAAMWGNISNKATKYGSTACGGTEQFEDIVQEALKLF